MSGTPTPVETPSRVAEQPQKALGQKEARGPKDGKTAVLQFAKMAEKAINSGNKGSEALAGIAGWNMMGRVNSQLQEMQGQVLGLLKNQKITSEKANVYLQRISKMSQQAQESIIPLLKNLDEAVKLEIVPGANSHFLRDLNYHYLINDIKKLEGNTDPDAQFELQELRNDLKKTEKEREGMKPEDDEIVKLALKLRGEKSLPQNFKDSPLKAVDDFFEHHLKRIVKSEGTRAQMAKRLGVAPEDLTNLVAVYEQGSQIGKEMTDLQNEIDPKKKNRLVIAAEILGGLTALLAWSAIKKESGQPG